MRKHQIQLIVILSIAAISVLIVVQFFWAKNIVELEDRHFDYKVKTALSEAGYKLRLIQHESISSIHPVKQITENQFVVEIQDIINPVAIDSILQDEFKQLELNVPYSIAIYDCFTDSVVYSLGGSNLSSTVPAEEYGVNWNINSYNFGVVFPKRNEYETGLRIWVVAVSLVFMLAILFIYLIYQLIRQKKLDQVKNEFINNMTHELKTPISTIALSADVLCNEEKDLNKIKRYAQIVKDENLRLKNQVERVLQTAFLETDRIQLEISPITLQHLLEKATSPYELVLEQRGGEIKMESLDVTLEIDEHHLSHVISNLIDNAIKYSNDTPKITISCKDLGSRISISVSDNGIGIAKENLSQVFKKFYRVPTGDVHNVKGFGIGLNYAKLIVEQHQGTISVKSTLGLGTTFVITIPKKLA